MPREISIAFQTDKTAAQYRELAQLVDDYAFDVVSVYCDAPYHPSYMPLALMAPHLHKARIGPAAVSPARVHPIDIAAQTALLADMAQAGVYAGFVRGAWLAAHGITEPKPALTAIREAVEITQYLLSGATGGYDGEVYSLAEHVTAPYPLPEQKIPIMIGTWGPKLCAIAGEIGDEVKIGGSANPDVVPVIQEYIAVGENRAGRDTGSVGVVIGAVSVVDDDGDHARAIARRQVALYLPVVASLDPTVEVEPERAERIREHVEQQNTEAAAALISDELLARFAFAGTPQDIIDHANRLFAAGTQRIEFGTPHGTPSAQGIKLLGEVVLPELQRQWQ